MENLFSKSQSQNPQAIADNLVIQELKAETLVYNLVTDKAICLNSTAAFVWTKCDGQNSVSDISQELARKTGQPVNEDVVWLTLNLLEKENLIVGNERTAVHFSGLSRREMIKKVGFATMIALPTIYSLAAPAAASAASTTGTRGFCDAACLADVGCVCNGTISCPPNTTVRVGVTAGICVSASAAVTALGTNIDANGDGAVCAVVNACI